MLVFLEILISSVKVIDSLSLKGYGKQHPICVVSVFLEVFPSHCLQGKHCSSPY